MQTNFTLEHQYKLFLEKSKLNKSAIFFESDKLKHDYHLIVKDMLNLWIIDMDKLDANTAFDVLDTMRKEAYRFLGLPTDKLEY